MYLKNQKFLIVGASKSGLAVTKYLTEEGSFCKVLEQLKTPKAIAATQKLKEMGIEVLTTEQAEDFLKEVDVVVLSPGVPINHEIAIKAKQLNKRIMGELEFAYLVNVPPLIAVTGTNGKTTTVTLLDYVFERAGIDRRLVGNVGVPMTSKIKDGNKNTVLIAEVSSFQLESVSSFSPHISCVLNVAPDHLERHYTMENYVFLKKRIFKNQRESEYTVLNFDDQTVKNFYPEIKAKIVWVSLREKVDGAYYLNGKIFWFDEVVVDVSELKIKGEHNFYNVAFVIAVSKLMGIETQIIADAIRSFNGVKHRLEFVCERNGVEFFNDSKATNTASTISAINALEKPAVLILGGSEKGEEYDLLFEKINQSKVKHVVLTGASANNMLGCAVKFNLSNISVVKDFNFAVKLASFLAKSGECVLFSPACASFDLFTCFEERGEAFVKAVLES